MKWDTKLIPVPPHCAICEHITKVSPNLPVCYHPNFKEKPELPRIPYPSHRSYRPDWCPEMPHSAEAMARYEEQMIIQGLKDEMMEKGEYSFVDLTPGVIKQVAKDMKEAGIFDKPKSRRLGTVDKIKEAMRRYALTCPHDDCSTPEEK